MNCTVSSFPLEDDCSGDKDGDRESEDEERYEEIALAIE